MKPRPDQILAAYRAAKEAGATRFGIHMMTGSCVLEPEYWIEIVERMFSSMGEIRRELGIEFEFVNIGGGLGIPYRPGVPSVCFDELAETVKRTWDASLARYDPEVASGAKPAPLLYMENGRCMTGPFGFLVSRCEAVKKVQYGGKHSVYYGLDANMANLMRPGMYGSYHHITVPAKEKTTIQEQWRLGVDAAERADADSSSETKAGVSAAAAAASGAGDTATAAATSKQAHLAPGRALCNVVGTLCENNDWFAKERDLPADASRGDLFVIHDTGAHSHSMGFQYNGKLRAPEVLIRSGDNGEAKGRVDLIRTRETIEGLYANTKIAQGLEEH